MRVQDVMKTAVHTVAPGTAAGEAWEHMRAAGFHHLVVQDDSGVVGILSDRDIGGRRGAALRAGRTVADLMTTRVRTVAPTDTIRKAANIMRGRSIGCLVVVSGEQVVGLIPTSALLGLLGRGVERPTPTTTRWTLRHRVPHRPHTGATGVW